MRDDRPHGHPDRRPPAREPEAAARSHVLGRYRADPRRPRGARLRGLAVLRHQRRGPPEAAEDRREDRERVAVAGRRPAPPGRRRAWSSTAPRRWSGSRASARATSCRCRRGSPSGCWPRATGTSRAPPTPGQVGNYAIAAHRVTHGEPLRDMPKLRPGDTVQVETRTATYTYRLDTDPNKLIVTFADVWVIDRLPTNPRGGVAAGPAPRPEADHADHLRRAVPHRQPDDRVRAPRRHHPPLTCQALTRPRPIVGLTRRPLGWRA